MSDAARDDSAGGALFVELADAAATHRLGVAIGRACRAGDVVALEGALGAGKTGVVRGMAQGLGLDSAGVSSPTYVLVQEYAPAPGNAPAPGSAPGPGSDSRRVSGGGAGGDESRGGAVTLVHVDAYRLDGPEDLETIGWGQAGEGLRAGAVVAVEWASRVGSELPGDRLVVALEHVAGGRRATLVGFGGWAARVGEVGAGLRGV
jgi:tRNA threonylcarbamoyladenosine biosynthesis protein TsaE